MLSGLILVLLTSVKLHAYSWHWLPDKGLQESSLKESNLVNSLEIKLSAESQVEELRYSLADIVTCKGPDSDCAEFLSRDLGESPKPGVGTIIKKSKIRAMVQNKSEEALVTWMGPSHIKVIRSYIDIPAIELHSYINKYLSKQNTKNKRYKVGRIFKKSFKLASNYHTLKVLENKTFLTNSKAHDYDKKKNVQLTVHDQEDSVLQIVEVDFHLDVLHHTLEATRDIKGNELFTEQNIGWVWAPYNSRLRLQYVDSFENVKNSRATRGISKGTVLRTVMLKEDLLVRRGDLVNLQMGSPKLVINTKGKILEEGSKGDTIDVLSLATNKILRAKIINSSLVSLDE